MRSRTVHLWLGRWLLPVVALLVIACGGPSGPPVADQFMIFYNTRDGRLILGKPLSQLVTFHNLPAQYFERGRLELRPGGVRFGLIVQDLLCAAQPPTPGCAPSPLPVGGAGSMLTYAQLALQTTPDRRLPPPPKFRKAIGVYTYADGSVFIPYRPDLHAHSGHTVPKVFWDYMNRTDLFPDLWLNTLGLPLTQPVTTSLASSTGRSTITVQAFQRAILIFDPDAAAGRQVSEQNVGTDYVQVFPEAIKK